MAVRLLLVSAWYPPHLGGVEQFSRRMAEEMARRGWEVTVLTSAMPGQAREEKGAVRVLRRPSLGLFGDRFPLPLPSPGLTRLLGKETFDLVWVQTRFYPLSLWGARFAAQRGLPCLIQEHGTRHLTWNRPLPDRLTAAWEHLLTRREAKTCDFAGVSEAACDWLTHFGLPRGRLLVNSPDTTVVPAAPPLPTGLPRVLYVGRLEEEKGVLLLCEGLKRLQTPCTLVFVGDGSAMERLRAAAPTGTVFTGRMSPEGAAGVLAGGGIYCLLSRAEGLPTALMEAMYRGCLCLGTRVGGVEELLEGGCGLLVSPAPPAEEVAAALERLLSLPPAEADAMRRAAREKITKEYSLTRSGDGLEAYAKEKGIEDTGHRAGT